MTIGLAIACGVLLCASVALALLYFKANAGCHRQRAELARFGEIADLEKHAIDQAAKVEAASAQLSKAQLVLERLEADVATRNATLSSQKTELDTQQRALATAAQMLGEYQTLEGIRHQID